MLSSLLLFESLDFLLGHHELTLHLHVLHLQHGLLLGLDGQRLAHLRKVIVFLRQLGTHLLLLFG